MENKIPKLPKELEALIADETYTTDSIGMSGSGVYIFEDKVLKIQPENSEAANERELMKWLEGKITVPSVIYHTVEDGTSFLLMTRIKGKMTCDEEYMKNPRLLTSILARGLKDIWKVDITDCPVRAGLDEKLLAAGTAIEAGEVDMDNTEPETFGENGFKDPEDLLNWLKSNRPAEEPVLTHGDYCLPNIFMMSDGKPAFIDIGRGGIGDKWQDIALAYRSLIHNFDGKYSGKVYEGFEPAMLFEELGIEPDWDKIRYYILLDELF